MTRAPAACLLCLVALCPSGCVVGRIDRNLAETTQAVRTIAPIVPALERTNQLMAETNARLDDTQRALADMRARLERLEGVVVRVDQRLTAMDPIERSLGRIDQHLAALRKSMENVDRAVPLMDVTEGTAPVESATPPGRRPGDPDPATRPAPPPPAQPGPGEPRR